MYNNNVLTCIYFCKEEKIRTLDIKGIKVELSKILCVFQCKLRYEFI